MNVCGSINFIIYYGEILLNSPRHIHKINTDTRVIGVFITLHYTNSCFALLATWLCTYVYYCMYYVHVTNTGGVYGQ